MNRPLLLLADEPTGNLDSSTADEVIEVISSYVRENSTTVVLVTHDEDLAEGFADRVLRIHDGRFLESSEAGSAEAARIVADAILGGMNEKENQPLIDGC